MTSDVIAFVSAFCAFVFVVAFGGGGALVLAECGVFGRSGYWLIMPFMLVLAYLVNNLVKEILTETFLTDDD